MPDLDLMSDFAPEPAGDSVPKPVEVPDHVSLQELVGLEIVIHWDEAVAVVEELCARLLPRGGGELAVPDLDHVFLTAGGGITIARGGRTEAGATGVGRMLHTLLSAADVPVQLRLFVTQSTAPETYASLAEFASALAYYGKPDRSELIRSVFERYAASAPRTASSRSHPSEQKSPPPLPGGDKRLPPDERRRSPVPWLVAAVVVFFVLAGVWLWRTARWQGGGSEDRATTTLASAVGAVQNLGTQARNALRLDSSAAPDPDRPSPAPTPATGSARAPTRDRSPARAAAARAPAILSAAGGPLPSATVQPLAPADAPPVPRVAANATERSRGEGPVPFFETEARSSGETPVIYSSDDDDVLPPVLLQPQLPAPLMAVDPHVATENRMELLVGPDGTVERVRLLAGPGRMPDMMLLSGAKMWKFAPATKDGQPVRYRTVVVWAAYP